MKKILITIAAMTVLSISGAKAWQVDVNVGGVYVGVGESYGHGYVDVWTPHGGGSGSWVKHRRYKPIRRSIKRSSRKHSSRIRRAKIRRIRHRRLRRR